MLDSDDMLATIERDAARQDQLAKLFGWIVLAAIALLSAKVVDLI